MTPGNRGLTLHGLIESHGMTPSELRNCAQFACIMWEQEHVRPVMFTSPGGRVEVDP